MRILLFLLFPISFLGAQSDSLTVYLNNLSSIKSDTVMVDSLYDIAWNIWREQPGVAIDLLDHLEKYQLENDFPYREDVKYYYRSLIYKSESNFEKSESNLLQYLNYHTVRQDTLRQAFAHQALCNLYYDFRHLNKSMQAAYQVLELKKDHLDTTTAIVIKGRIGAILNDLGDHQGALQQEMEVLKIAEAYNEKSFIANISMDIGLIYEQLGNLDSMFYYYRRTLDIAKETDNGHQELYVRFNLATAYENSKQYEAALAELKVAKHLAQTNHDRAMLELSQIHMASSLLGLNQVNDAMNEIKDIDPDKSNLDVVKEYYLIVSDVESKRKNYDAALTAYQQFKSYSDSILNQNVTEQINELKAKYEADLKERQISELNQENKIIELKLKNANRDKAFIFTGIIGLTLLLLLLYNYTRVIVKNRKQLQEKNDIISVALQDKETLLKEIHHRVKNNLQMISSLLSIQSRNVQDPTAKLAIKEGRNRVKSVALIHQNLYQEDNLIGTNVSDYVHKLSNSLFKSYNVKGDLIRLRQDIDAINLDVEKIIPIGLILNELISNSLKYAFEENSPGEIYIGLKNQPDRLTLEVKDNGKGMDPDFDIQRDGNIGYELIRSFLFKLNATLALLKTEKGTHSIIEIPKSA